MTTKFASNLFKYLGKNDERKTNDLLEKIQREETNVIETSLRRLEMNCKRLCKKYKVIERSHMLRKGWINYNTLCHKIQIRDKNSLPSVRQLLIIVEGLRFALDKIPKEMHEFMLDDTVEASDNKIRALDRKLRNREREERNKKKATEHSENSTREHNDAKKRKHINKDNTKVAKTKKRKIADPECPGVHADVQTYPIRVVSPSKAKYHADQLHKETKEIIEDSERIQKEVKELTEELERIKTEIDKGKTSMDQLQLKEEETKQRIAESNNTLDNLNGDINNKESERNDLEATVEEKSKTVKELEATLSTLNDDINKKMVEKVNLEKGVEGENE